MSGRSFKTYFASTVGRMVLAVGIAALCMSVFGCWPQPYTCEGLQNCRCDERSTLLIIGEDMSKSFHQHKGISDAELQRICELLMNNGGGRIEFFTIGAPKVQAFVTCVLKPLPAFTEAASMTEKVRCNKHKQDVLADNRNAIAAFLSNCAALRASANSSYTDINGFLAQANKMFLSEQSKHERMLLYINSDGKHEAGPGGVKPVNTSLFRSGHTVLSGWGDAVTGGVPAEHNLLSPSFFVIFWDKYLKQ